jgi:uncharacterized protein YggT (Ycf19 family)
MKGSQMAISFSLAGIIDIFFRVLILCLLVRVILSWIVSFSLMSPGNPFFRFFNRVTDPILYPIANRIPRTALMAFDLGLIVALLFCWWGLSLLDGLVLFSLPTGW